MDIYSSVGKSGMNKPSDVALVQAALINHKDGQFWRGPIDGKVGLGINDRIDNAIIAFQQHHKLPVTSPSAAKTPNNCETACHPNIVI